MIFETHAHYDDSAFEKDRNDLLLSLPEQNIKAVINVGADMKSCKTTLELAEKYDYIYAAIGVHPSDTGNLTEDDIIWLRNHTNKEKVVAIGEIGLDYYWKEPALEIQKKWFIEQLNLAREVKLPVIIHSRDAAKDTLDIMKAERAEEIGGVIHCFSYTKEMAQEFLKLNFSFGIGGVVTFNNAKKLKEAVHFIPIDKILLETDSPYLAPVPNRGKRNSSLNIPYIIKEIAQIKGITEEEVERITEENAKKIFLNKGVAQ